MPTLYGETLEDDAFYKLKAIVLDRLFYLCYLPAQLFALICLVYFLITCSIWMVEVLLLEVGPIGHCRYSTFSTSSVICQNLLISSPLIGLGWLVLFLALSLMALVSDREDNEWLNYCFCLISAPLLFFPHLLYFFFQWSRDRGLLTCCYDRNRLLTLISRRTTVCLFYLFTGQSETQFYQQQRELQALL